MANDNESAKKHVEESLKAALGYHRALSFASAMGCQHCQKELLSMELSSVAGAYRTLKAELETLEPGVTVDLL